MSAESQHCGARRSLPWASGQRSMTADQLTAILAERVLGWGVGPDRFLLGGRRWLPRWRFQPLTRIEDAFQVLEKEASTFTLALRGDGTFSAQVQVRDHAGSALGASKAATITVAVARAIGLNVPDVVLEVKKR
jgi:hypothetical protein